MRWCCGRTGLRIRLPSTRTAEGSVSWQDHNTLLYENIRRFTMGQFRSTVHGLVVQASALLTDELLLCKDMPAVPWQTMCDNPMNRMPGWSFLKDTRTKWPVDGRTWMLDRVKADCKLQRKFYTQGQMSPAKVTHYAKVADELLERLLVLPAASRREGRNYEVFATRTRWPETSATFSLTRACWCT